LKGEACVFVPKSGKDLKDHLLNDKKKLAFEDYMTYIKKYLTEPQVQKEDVTTSKNNPKKLRLQRSSSFMMATASTSNSVQKMKENLAKERIFNPEVKVYQGKPQDDLTFDEKLLVLNEKISQPYFHNGIATYKKVSILRTGGYFGELALLFNQPRTASVIASEDLHLLYLSSEDYKDLFECEIDNMWKKYDFFKLMFTDISSTLIAKFCYLLEEKRFMHNEVIYKENDSPDGIYIIKHGEVQLSTILEGEEQEENPSSPSKAHMKKKAPMYKRKIIVF